MLQKYKIFSKGSLFYSIIKHKNGRKTEKYRTNCCYLIQVLHVMDNLCGNGLKGLQDVSPGLY